ncbi:MAG: MarR family transcriptional regulator [Rhodobacteraceae bacterium]|nr:MarR family transcriptional regulator [Paracoccaceae bacterium]
MNAPKLTALFADTADFDLANRLFFRLYQCSNLMHKHGTRYVSDYGATTQQWAVLGALARPKIAEQGMSVKDLTEFLLLSRQNLTVVLERLETRGLIERVRDPSDGRSKLIRLSSEGVVVWGEMQKVIGGFYVDALKDLGREEAIDLVQLLDKLRSGLNAL